MNTYQYSLGSYFWQKLKTTMLVVVLGIFVISSFSLFFMIKKYKENMLDTSIQLLTLNINESVKAGDWDLAQKNVKISSNQFKIFNIFISTNTGNRLMGPIGKKHLGFFESCQSSSNPIGLIVSGCLNLFSIQEIGLYILILMIALIIFIVVILNVKFKVTFLLSELESSIYKIASVENSNVDFSHQVIELNLLFKKVKELMVKNENTIKLQSMATIALQVSHDIRSPLAALNMLMASDLELAEDKRIIMRSAITRINDIANQLLDKGKSKSNITIDQKENVKCIELISSIVDSIISEKRIQFRDKINVKIESKFEQSYGLFAKVNSVELRRTISNLLNNAIEALPDSKGDIIVKVAPYVNFVQILIKDNGKGIPAHVIARLGEMGVSHGKAGTESGSGLGVYHAKKTIESFHGQFKISSTESKGTDIEILLPRSETPKWFVDKINISPSNVVVSVDDDLSVHQIWKDRLIGFSNTHLTFTSGEEFKKWYLNFTNKNEVLILIDYEFLNQEQNGLDIIEELNIESEVILVSSRYEEPIVRNRALRLNIAMIPKSSAYEVPIMLHEKKHYDVILIDDDELMQLIWSSAAKKACKSFIGFKSPVDFFNSIDTFDLESHLYFDSELGNDFKGEVESMKAFEYGFKSIYLCTGHEADHFKNVNHIKAIIGKVPTFFN